MILRVDLILDRLILIGEHPNFKMLVIFTALLGSNSLKGEINPEQWLYLKWDLNTVDI